MWQLPLRFLKGACEARQNCAAGLESLCEAVGVELQRKPQIGEALAVRNMLRKATDGGKPAWKGMGRRAAKKRRF